MKPTRNGTNKFCRREILKVELVLFWRNPIRVRLYKKEHVYPPLTVAPWLEDVTSFNIFRAGYRRGRERSAAR